MMIATSSTSTESEKLRKRIDQLFLRFAAVYGHMWRSLYKSDEFLAYTKQEWIGSLEKFDSTILNQALVHCKEKEPYPPSLPLFVEICKSFTRSPDGFAEKKGESQKADPAIARMHLDKMRALLNMKPR